MKKTLMILAVLSIILLIGTAGLGLSLEEKPNLKKAHMHMALMTATLSMLAHIMSIIVVSKSKDDAPSS
jgi:hypothetical protein